MSEKMPFNYELARRISPFIDFLWKQKNHEGLNKSEIVQLSDGDEIRKKKRNDKDLNKIISKIVIF
ncbi:hypothetical protein HZS_457 [Henneguya salminicola]|nr:hypothetical protein HZS_457 [Henneguya salminicola]